VFIAILYLAFFVLGAHFYGRKQLCQLSFTEPYSLLNITITEEQLAFPLKFEIQFQTLFLTSVLDYFQLSAGLKIF